MNLCVLLTYKKYPSLLFRQFSFWQCFFIFFFFIYQTSYSQVDEGLNELHFSERHRSKYQIDQINISGNKVTKEKIILRELNFKVGDSLTLHELEYAQTRSQQNLINTSLFNFVTITFTLNDSTHTTTLGIDVKERWYIWPNAILEIQDRNFNSWWAKKDLFRINYGMFIDIENFRGRNESVILKIRKGYTELYGFSYRKPYLNKKQTIGLNVSYNYFGNNEISYATYGNQLMFYRNYKNYVRKEQEAKLGFTYRHGLYMRHSLELLYKTTSISDTIKKLNASYFTSGLNNLAYLSLQYWFRRDYRDSKVYPKTGYCIDVNVVKDGLNLFKNENVDNFFIATNLTHYWKLAPRIYTASGVKLRYMINNTPVYYFNRALGFNDFVRGYEYYVVDGQSFSMFKADVKYQIIKPRVINVPVKKLDKFSSIPYSLYLTVYGDAAYVQDKFYYSNNPLSNSWLGSCGVGIDLVTYYDYVFRVEASMNRMFQKGIYLHFTAPI